MATVSPFSVLKEAEGAVMEWRKVAIRKMPRLDRCDASLGPR
jgi:hypothetical protein